MYSVIQNLFWLLLQLVSSHPSLRTWPQGCNHCCGFLCISTRLASSLWVPSLSFWASPCLCWVGVLPEFARFGLVLHSSGKILLALTWLSWLCCLQWYFRQLKDNLSQLRHLSQVKARSVFPDVLCQFIMSAWGGWHLGCQWWWERKNKPTRVTKMAAQWLILVMHPWWLPTVWVLLTLSCNLYPSILDELWMHTHLHLIWGERLGWTMVEVSCLPRRRSSW